MAAYVTGYEDERFQHPVGQSLHCNICTNVIRDPVMCRENEHVFCRACITRYLMNYQRCPTCMEPLTVDTLKQASRGVRNLLSELKIRCEFFDRGCGEFIELGDLERHVRDCGYAPAVCSNEGCELEVNKRDLLHHETVVCELRRVQCHSCNDIRQEMDTLKANLAAMTETLVENGECVKATKEEVLGKVGLVQEQLNNQEVNIYRVQADIVEMKKCLNEITRQLLRSTQQTSHEVQAEQEQMKKGIAEADGMDEEPKVVIAGGSNEAETLNSVEMFSLSKGTWTPLQPMRKGRHAASSVVYNNQLFVAGGFGVKSIETLSMNAVHVDQSITWENFPAELSEKLRAHGSVVYDGRLFIIRGFDSITEISLFPPYTRKRLATMPQRRCYHGVALFEDKIVIVGGAIALNSDSALQSVVMYDITKNECKGMAPLPYPVSRMATVKWGDDHIIIMGGRDRNGQALNTVVMYNIKTQKSHRLPDMKYKREGCVAAVVRDTVIVMGGEDEREQDLNSVEGFKFDRFTWEELPRMHEARCGATAVVC